MAFINLGTTAVSVDQIQRFDISSGATYNSITATLSDGSRVGLKSYPTYEAAQAGLATLVSHLGVVDSAVLFS